MDGPLLGTAQLGGVAVLSRSQGLKPPEGAGDALEEQLPVTRDLEGEHGARSAEVDQIQAIGSESRSEHHVEDIEVDGSIAAHRDVQIAPGPCSAPGRRPE